MGSSYFGEPKMGNGRSSGSSSSSSKKGKRSNSDKPKQPQRGLGVAQLEKIRLHHQMGCNYVPSPYPSSNLNQEDMRVETTYSSVPSSSSSFSYSSSTTSIGYNPNMMMGFGDQMQGANNRYDDALSCSTTRWNQHNIILDTQYAMQPGMTRPLLSLQIEESEKRTRKDKHRSSIGSGSRNSPNSSEMQEIDLDLKL